MAEIKSKKDLITLRSSATYPVEFIYNGEKTFIPPLGTLHNVDKNLIGDLPKNVRIVRQP